jgi:hypothetical protein
MIEILVETVFVPFICNLTLKVCSVLVYVVDHSILFETFCMCMSMALFGLTDD